MHSFKKKILFLILLIKCNTSISYNNVYAKKKLHHTHTQCPALKPLWRGDGVKRGWSGGRGNGMKGEGVVKGEGGGEGRGGG